MEESLILLQEVDNLLELGESGYAQTIEVDNEETKTKNFLLENIKKESILWRKFDKWNSVTRWKVGYPPKYANKGQLGILEQLREFLIEFIEENNLEIPRNQKWIKADATYTGRRILRNDLLLATQTIDIQDNFVGIKLLDILEQCLIEKPNLHIRILTKNGNYKDLKPFIVEFPNFKNQFQNTELRSHDQSHGRFNIIDSSRVFIPGASGKDIGKKADLYSEVTDIQTKQDLISDFELWWTNGTPGVSIV